MRVGSIRYDGDTYRLHVVPASSGEPDELRAFRDRLRADPVTLQVYVRLKREIIEGRTTDSIDYSIIKGVFVQDALNEMNR